MLNISGISEGFVLDHIQAGMSLKIYHDLGLDKLDCTVAIIKNARSSKMGKKDIIKVECSIDALDLDILGLLTTTLPSTSSKVIRSLKNENSTFQNRLRMSSAARIQDALLRSNRNLTRFLF